MNLRDFTDQHGVIAIVRRHFDYRSPLPEGKDGSVKSSLKCALTYSRTVEAGKLGLTHRGSEMAFKQGQMLAQWGIIPKEIITGCDQRNMDGGLSTQEAIKEEKGVTVPVKQSPAVTYPYYSDIEQSERIFDEFGDFAVHMYLAEQEEVAGLWTEPSLVFNARITGSFHIDPGCRPVLFDLNFEQMVLLHYSHVEKIHGSKIPFKKSDNPWTPSKGGGIVYGEDGTVAEFTPELEIIQ